MNDKKDHGEEQRREHFRIEYPYTERPKLTITGGEFTAIDVSETGMKFAIKKPLRAAITFHDGETLNVEGEILRIQGNEVVVRFSKGIPPRRIMKEQQYLLSKYIGYR